MFILFHKRVCGPLASALFHHRAHSDRHPSAKIEGSYHTADAAIQRLVDLVAA